MTAHERLYLDANATTAPLPEVVTAVHDALTRTWGNPSSLHEEGRTARRALRQATEQAAALLGCPPEWLTWTSGGTESLNTAVAALAEATTSARRTVLTTGGEHPAVRQALARCTARGQFEVELLPTDELGRVTAEDLAARLNRRDDVAGVVVIGAHNETGGVQPLAAIAELCLAHEIRLIVDGVQWTGKRPIALADAGIDAWAVSAHKFGGPKGVGLLAARPGWIDAPLIVGGPQQRRRRAGTENIPGIVGAGVACALAETEMQSREQRWTTLRDELIAGLRAWPDVDMLYDPDGLAQTLLLALPDWSGSMLAQRLDLEGIAVSTGSACSSGATRASDALLGLGHDEHLAERWIRISFPPRAPRDAASRLLQTLRSILTS
ncbi:MAG: cysteine desulfurase [Candidatus Dadabacteria bacterium]|nr:MAG: cysteine desulfurase [Candidatus Dadabacteria bacterium]